MKTTENPSEQLQDWQLWGSEPKAGFPTTEAPKAFAARHKTTHSLVIAVRLLGVLTLLTGVVYPLVVTLMAKLAFPHQAEGSLMARDGRIVGSELIAQRFIGPDFFWPRPSAGDDGTNFATVPSAASNKGPIASDLKSTVEARARTFRAAHGLAPGARVPSEMIFASGSGIDPDISPESARLQIDRVARARNFSAGQRQQLVSLAEQSIERPQWGFLGEPRVNVLKLNLALERIH